MSVILIPTDFSKSSRNAAEYAIAMFGNEQSYILLNVYEEPRASVTSMVSLQDILAEASIDSLVEEKLRLSEKYPEIQFSVESIYGNPNNVISQYSNREDVDIIVMGSKGTSSLTKLILGSAAVSVLQDAKIPVFAVPESYQFDGLKKVLLAVDLTHDDTHLINQFVLSLLKENKSKLTILTVTEDKDKIDMERVENAFSMHNSLDRIDHDFEVIEGEEVSATIQNYARENDYSLVVTIPRQVSWFKRILNPSISKNLAEHVQRPMLALH